MHATEALETAGEAASMPFAIDYSSIPLNSPEPFRPIRFLSSVIESVSSPSPAFAATILLSRTVRRWMLQPLRLPSPPSPPDRSDCPRLPRPRPTPRC